MFAQCSAAVKRALTIISILHAPSRHTTTAVLSLSPPRPQIPSSSGTVVTITVMDNHLHLYCFSSRSPLQAGLLSGPLQARFRSSAISAPSPAHPQPGHICQLHTVKVAGEMPPCEHCLPTRNIPSWGPCSPLGGTVLTPETPAAKGRLAGTENWWPQEGK